MKPMGIVLLGVEFQGLTILKSAPATLDSQPPKPSGERKCRRRGMEQGPRRRSSPILFRTDCMGAADTCQPLGEPQRGNYKEGAKLKSIILGLAALAILGVVVDADAVSVQASTGVRVTTRDCIAGSIGACEDISAIRFDSYGGEPGGLTATATIALPAYGNAFSDVALSGEIGAPILSGSAVANVSKRTNSNTFALQRYTYVGTETTTRTFGGALSYSQVIADPNNLDYQPHIQAGVSAVIDVFTTLSEFVDAGSSAQDNWNILRSFAIGLNFADGAPVPGYTLLGSTAYKDNVSTDPGFATLEVPVELSPGQSVWVYVLLQTPASNGSTVDAYGTLITRWDDAAELVPAAVLVPEPGSLALLGLGLAGLGLSRRRKAA